MWRRGTWLQNNLKPNGSVAQLELYDETLVCNGKNIIRAIQSNEQKNKPEQFSFCFKDVKGGIHNVYSLKPCSIFWEAFNRDSSETTFKRAGKISLLVALLMSFLQGWHALRAQLGRWRPSVGNWYLIGRSLIWTGRVQCYQSALKEEYMCRLHFRICLKSFPRETRDIKLSYKHQQTYNKEIHGKPTWFLISSIFLVLKSMDEALCTKAWATLIYLRSLFRRNSC